MTSGNNDTEVGSSSADRVEKDCFEDGSRESASDLEKAEVVANEDEEAGRGHWVKSTLLTMLLLLIAMQFSFQLSQYIIDGDDGRTASVSLVGSMILGIVAMVTLFQQIWAGKVHPRDNQRQNVQVNAILRDNLSLVGIIFFCPFACLLDIFQIYTEASCGESWRMINDYEFHASDVVYRLLHIIFMALELIFCIQFRRLVLNQNVSKFRSFCVQLSLAVVVAANIGLWSNITLHETLDSTMPRKDLANESIDSYKDCLISNFGNVEENVRHALYPFSIEFSLLVVEFVVSHLMLKTEHDEHDIKPRPPKPEKRPKLLQTFLSQQLCFRSEACDNRNVILPSTPPMVIVFGVLPNLVFFTFAFFSKNEIFGTDFTQTSVADNQQFVIFYWLFMILLVVIGFLCGSKFKAGKDKLKGIDYLVMASAFGPILARVLRLIIILENLGEVAKSFEPVFVLLPELLQLLQLLLQLPFLFYADCVHKSTAEDGQKFRWRVFKSVVLCLAMWNIMLWLTDSVLLKVDVVQTIFKDSRWNIFDGIFRPFAIFFRFNSFLILLRAYLR